MNAGRITPPGGVPRTIISMPAAVGATGPAPSIDARHSGVLLAQLTAVGPYVNDGHTSGMIRLHVAKRAPFIQRCQLLTELVARNEFFLNTGAMWNDVMSCYADGLMVTMANAHDLTSAEYRSQGHFLATSLRSLPERLPYADVTESDLVQLTRTLLRIAMRLEQYHAFSHALFTTYARWCQYDGTRPTLAWSFVRFVRCGHLDTAQTDLALASVSAHMDLRGATLDWMLQMIRNASVRPFILTHLLRNPTLSAAQQARVSQIYESLRTNQGWPSRD